MRILELALWTVQKWKVLKKLQVVLWGPCEAMLTYYIVLAFTFVIQAWYREIRFYDFATGTSTG